MGGDEDTRHSTHHALSAYGIRKDSKRSLQSRVAVLGRMRTLAKGRKPK